jgi:general secretion pathway protein D
MTSISSHRTRRRTPAWRTVMALSLAGTWSVHAQVLLPPPAPGPAAPAAPSPLPVTRPTLPVARPIAGGANIDTHRTVELKFNAAPVEMVLQWYCENLTGRTLLQAPNITASITLRSQTELTVPEAIQAIKTVLAMNNIGLVEVGEKFVKVVPITAVQQEGLAIQTNVADAVSYPETDELISEVIPLKYIDPAEAQKSVQGLIHAYGKLLPLERINSLLVADTAMNLNRIRDILGRIDQPLDIKESINIITIRHSKASEIKTKLDEIIADQKEKDKQPTVKRLKESGAPGVDTAPAAPAIPGVIRARPAAPAAGGATAEPSAEDGRMIRGDVKTIADDRTGILIIITRPENMRFFNQVVTALDVATAPDVSVELVRLEYADAEEVASMLNALIGAPTTSATRKSGSSAKKTTPDTKSGASPAPGATSAPAESSRPQAAEPARSFQLQEFIEQQRQLSAGKGAEGKTKIGQLSAENIKILADTRLNGLIVMASKGDMIAIKELIKNMDIRLSQVLIEAVIMQVTLDKTLERGVDWVQRSMIAFNRENGGRDPLFSFAGAGGGGKALPLDATGLNTSMSSGGGLTYYFTQFGLNLDAVIKMSQTDNRSRILASPVILTTDNKEAKIDVSEERYFYKGTSYVGYYNQNQQAVPNVEARKVGLTLTVTPRINAKKFVVMEIEQKIENVSGTQPIQGADGKNDWPIVASREMNAAVSVRSGETIILGGLVEHNTSQDVTGVPWLSKLPILGIPFRSSSDKSKRAEIVVFITPYVLDTPEEIEEESARRKASLNADSRGLWEKGWSDSKLADPPRGRFGRFWRNLLK